MNNTQTPQGIYGQVAGLKSTSNLSLPADVAVYVLADSSSSMCGLKEQEANAALVGLFQACADPITRDAIRITVITFDNNASLKHRLQAPSSLSQHANIIQASGSTDLTSALALVENEIAAYTARPERKPLKPFVIIFSDGAVDSPSSATTIANRLKNQAYIFTTGFGSDADEPFLRSIATSPDHYSKADIGQLKQLMENIGKSVSRYSSLR